MSYRQATSKADMGSGSTNASIVTAAVQAPHERAPEVAPHGAADDEVGDPARGDGGGSANAAGLRLRLPTEAAEPAPLPPVQRQSWSDRAKSLVLKLSPDRVRRLSAVVGEFSYDLGLLTGIVREPPGAGEGEGEGKAKANAGTGEGGHWESVRKGRATQVFVGNTAGAGWSSQLPPRTPHHVIDNAGGQRWSYRSDETNSEPSGPSSDEGSASVVHDALGADLAGDAPAEGAALIGRSDAPGALAAVFEATAATERELRRAANSGLLGRRARRGARPSPLVLPGGDDERAGAPSRLDTIAFPVDENAIAEPRSSTLLEVLEDVDAAQELGLSSDELAFTHGEICHLSERGKWSLLLGALLIAVITFSFGVNLTCRSSADGMNKERETAQLAERERAAWHEAKVHLDERANAWEQENRFVPRPFPASQAAAIEADHAETQISSKVPHISSCAANIGACFLPHTSSEMRARCPHTW